MKSLTIICFENYPFPDPFGSGMFDTAKQNISKFGGNYGVIGGLDILNPAQPLAKGMTPGFLKKEYGNDLIFFGGICVQDLLPNGTPATIKDEIKRRMEIFGAGGGYIAAPAHNVQDDTPVENILAVFEAIRGE